MSNLHHGITERRGGVQMVGRMWMGAALIAVACSSTDVNFSESEGRIEVSPVLQDLGSVPVGSVHTFELQVDHLGGAAVGLRNVVVNNTDAGLFAYTAERGACPSPEAQRFNSPSSTPRQEQVFIAPRST